MLFLRWKPREAAARVVIRDLVWERGRHEQDAVARRVDCVEWGWLLPLSSPHTAKPPSSCYPVLLEHLSHSFIH
jgi:hypothetical protein